MSKKTKEGKRRTYKQLYGKEKAIKINLKKSKALLGRKKGALEEQFGKEKADKIKEKIGRRTRNKSYIKLYGKKKAIKINLKKSKALKNKSYIKLYGKEKANKLIAKRKNKSYIKLYGKEKADKIKEKISKSKKGISWIEKHGKKGAKKRKLKLSQKTRIWSKEKIINNLIEIIKKIGPIKRSDIPNLSHYYNICGSDTMRRRFGSFDNLALEGNIKFKLSPNKAGMGTNEKQMLDNIEEEKGIVLLRQYSVARCFIDGYDKTNNIAYEIDEWKHKYQKIEDLLRENKIKQVLDCKFIRIPG